MRKHGCKVSSPQLCRHLQASSSASAHASVEARQLDSTVFFPLLCPLRVTNSSICPQHIPDALWVTDVTRSHRLCGRAEYLVAFADQDGRRSPKIFGIDGVFISFFAEMCGDYFGSGCRNPTTGCRIFLVQMLLQTNLKYRRSGSEREA